MVTDNQARRLKKMLSEGKNLSISAARAGMDEKTARKYRGYWKAPVRTKKRTYMAYKNRSIRKRLEKNKRDYFV